MPGARPRFAAVALLVALGAALSAVVARPSANATLPAVKHVFVIVLENESADTTFGSSSPATYLAKTLVSQGAFVPNYYGIGHASLDNYIAMISGQAPNPVTQADCGTYADFTVTGATTADGQATGNGCVYPATIPTLASQLDTAGLTWRGYMDSMGADSAREPATCGHPKIGSPDNTQAASPVDQYATRHDPFMYFHSIIDNQSYCDSHVVPLTSLAADLASSAKTPNFSFITPSLCNDGHDGSCANGQPGGLAQVNTFLQTLIPQIESSVAYQQDGLIAIIFDESAGSDTTACCNEPTGPNVTQPGGGGPGGGRTGAVFISPFIAPGTTTQTAYNHYSLLRSIEDLFGLSHLGFAAQDGLTPLGTDVFTAVPSPTTSTTTTTGTTTSTTTRTTTTTTTPSTTCRPATSGLIIGATTVKRKSGSLSRLQFTARRAGVLTFQIIPAKGHALSVRHRTLAACALFSLTLPAGHGTVQLSAATGKHHESRTVRY